MEKLSHAEDDKRSEQELVDEAIKHPARRKGIRFNLLFRKEELSVALRDVTKAMEQPGPDVSREQWRQEASGLLRQISTLEQAIKVIDSLSSS